MHKHFSINLTQFPSVNQLENARKTSDVINFIISYSNLKDAYLCMIYSGIIEYRKFAFEININFLALL